MSRSCVPLLAFALACGPPASSATVVEIPPPPDSPSPPIPAVAPQRVSGRAPSESDCAQPPALAGCVTVARVRVSNIELSSPTCYVDTVMRGGEIGRVQQCSQGAAIVFDRAAFGGMVDSSHVDVCTASRFPFSDGCTWQSLQRVRGRLQDGLVFTYTEAPVEGERCASSSCRARAMLTVVP